MRSVTGELLKGDVAASVRARPADPWGRKVRYALAGVGVSLGAPGGWLLFRALTAAGPFHPVSELSQDAALYAYLTLSTAFAFSLFGVVLGASADKLARTQKLWEELAITDTLTGLRNTRYFHERLAAECARADREGSLLALVVGDVDFFKRVNDTYGHAAGDKCLRHVARALREHARFADVPCRIGGEEFALICPSAELSEGHGVAERIRRALEVAPVQTTSHRIPLTVSFGVAARASGQSPAELFRHADEALYRAKAQGRNRVCDALVVLRRIGG